MNNGEQPITPSMWTRCGKDYEPLKDGQKTGWEIKFGGLTKREYFAIHLMQGLLSGADRHSQEGDSRTWNYERLSKISIQAADSLLKELESN
jgi:hypothetical protein